FPCRTMVEPDDRRVRRPQIGIHRAERWGHAPEAHSYHASVAILQRQLTGSLDKGPPPVFRVLLHGLRLWRRQSIGNPREAKLLARQREQASFQRARADVDAENGVRQPGPPLLITC